MLNHKKIILIIMILFTIPSISFAEYNWEAVGEKLGEALAKQANSREKDRKDYINEKYNFAKIDKIFVIASVPEGYEQYIADPKITQYCFNIIFNGLKKKNENNLTVRNFHMLKETIDAQYKADPGSLTYSEFWHGSIMLYFPAVLYVDIYGAAINQRGEAVSLMNLTLKDSFTDEIIFQRSESRINRNVENYGSKAYIKPVIEIVDDYMERLNKEIKKSKK